MFELQVNRDSSQTFTVTTTAPARSFDRTVAVQSAVFGANRPRPTNMSIHISPEALALNSLLSRVCEGNRHAEVQSSGPVGEEVW